MDIDLSDYSVSGTFVSGAVYALYPADENGNIKNVTMSSVNLPEQVTGINVYRSNAIIEGIHSIEFDAISASVSEAQTDGFVLGDGLAWTYDDSMWVFEDEDGEEGVGSTVLDFHKVAYIPARELDDPFIVGSYILDDGALVNPGDDLEGDLTFKNYYTNLLLTAETCLLYTSPSPRDS